MFSSYFRSAIRNILRQKGYSFIAIFGLALGMASCIIILLYVFNELNYDRHHEFADRIYRVAINWLGEDGTEHSGFCSIAPRHTHYLRTDIPEVEAVGRMLRTPETLISYDDNNFIENDVWAAEPEILEIFTIPFISGNPETALSEPYGMVISRSVADKMFGDEDPLDKEILMDNQYTFTIRGVMENTSRNSHIHYDVLFSMITFQTIYPNWYNQFWESNTFTDNVTPTYLRLAENTDYHEINERLRSVIDQRLTGFDGFTDEDGNRPSENIRLFLQPVSSIHTSSHQRNEFETNASMTTINIFACIALFILLIGSINYVNLSTARSVARSKEVGLRKVVGAQRSSLILQFEGESLILVSISLLVAFLLIALTLPHVNAFIGKELVLNPIENPVFLWLSLAVFLFTGLVAGLYPAVYLSAFRPITILRGELTKGKKGAWLRKSLVVFQFFISIMLIISIATVFSQMHFLQNADLGFDRDQVIVFPLTPQMRADWTTVKNEFTSINGVQYATRSKRVPSGGLYDAPGYRTEVNGEANIGEIHMPHIRVEEDFLKTYGIEIIAGRDFSFEHSTDQGAAYIINETAVRRLGWQSPEDAVGAPMQVYGGEEGFVIGVVRDFHYESLRSPIKAMILYPASESNTVSLRISLDHFSETMGQIEETWSNFHPGYHFEYEFLNERLDQNYENEQRLMVLFELFSVLAISIACLGLFGLASYTAEQKTKEIGIRKTLGASISSIILLMTKEFSRLVIIGAVIAVPVAVYAMIRWLNSFAYHIDVSVGHVLFGVVAALAIALFSVAFQAIKASRTDPVISLRHE